MVELLRATGKTENQNHIQQKMHIYISSTCIHIYFSLNYINYKEIMKILMG